MSNSDGDVLSRCAMAPLKKSLLSLLVSVVLVGLYETWRSVARSVLLRSDETSFVSQHQHGVDALFPGSNHTVERTKAQTFASFNETQRNQSSPIRFEPPPEVSNPSKHHEENATQSVQPPSQSSVNNSPPADGSPLSLNSIPGPVKNWHNETYVWNGTLPSLRIAFIGDSLTRYQMLSLAYYLQNNETWFPSDAHPDLFQKNVPGKYSYTWNQYFQFSSQWLGQRDGKHMCDCYRREMDVHPGSRTLDLAFENRYVRINHASRIPNQKKHYLWYFSKYGNGSLHGHWGVDKVNKWRRPWSHSGGFNVTAQWSFHSIADFIVEYLAKLQPKPQYLIFNQGMWVQHDLNNVTFKEIQQALNQVGIIGIYKTTTKRLSESSPDLLPHDGIGCRMFPCLNLSWTAHLGRSSFSDGRNHFTTSINTKFNLQLFYLLDHLQNQHEEAE